MSEAPGSAVGFVKLLLELAGKLVGNRTSERQSLKNLADRKFNEIHQIHEKFIDLLTTLTKAVRAAAESVGRTGMSEPALSLLEENIRTLSDERYKESEKRRGLYEEARVYQWNLVIDRGIFNNIPDELGEQLRSFMSAYCAYFETDMVYRHTLRHALNEAEETIERLREVALDDVHQHVMDHFRGEFIHLYGKSSSLIEVSRSMWARIAEEYHKLNLCFRGYGVS